MLENCMSAPPALYNVWSAMAHCTRLFTMAVLALVARTALAQQPNFSGTYILAGATGDLRFDAKSTDKPILKVVQTPDELQTMRTEKGGTETKTLPLNGNEAEYRTLDGHTARARVLVRKKHLQVETVIPLRYPNLPNLPNLPQSDIHDMETWSLSGNAKSLKICGYAEVRGGIVQFRKSGCQIYKRQ